MDENDKPDGSTAMERLCREMVKYVVERLPASWCQDNGIYDGEPWSQCKGIARADIERRINEADLEDDRARDSALGWYKAKAAELDALRGAGRVVPEGCRWPSFGDGGRLALGGEAWTKDGGRVRVVAMSHRGRAAVRPWGRKDGAPIDEGDEVWTEDGCRWKVLGIKDGGHPVQAKCVEGCHRGKRRDLKWTWVSHERPDSWESLREDVRKVYTAYWGCIGLRCDECPALVDGKNPSERYDTIWCDTAMRFDLVARAERLAGVQGE